MISSLISGLIIGILARFVKPGADPMGWIMTIVVGVVGAMVGGFLASAINANPSGGFVSLAFSVVGAVIVLFAYEFITGKRKIGK